MHQQRQRRQRGEIAMQHSGRHGVSERLGHRPAHGLAMLEVLDELRGGGEIVANLAWHAHLRGEPPDQRQRRGRQRAIGTGKFEYA
jgi:hypothetical protein